MSSYFPKGDQALQERKWVLVDATDQVIGRLASQVAAILRGKTKATFAPHADNGDFVVVINAEKARFTGEKLEKKIYRHYTGYIGGLKEEKAGHLAARRPEKLIENAVQGMLPKTPLGRSQLNKLKICIGSKHPHAAQNPQPITLS